MLKTRIVCLEGPYPFQLKCFNEQARVIKLYAHKIYCKLKLYESNEKLYLSSNIIIQSNFISFNSYKN